MSPLTSFNWGFKVIWIIFLLREVCFFPWFAGDCSYWVHYGQFFSSSDIVYELCWTTVLDTKHSFSLFIDSSRAPMKLNISCTVLFFYCVGSRVHMGSLIFSILLHTSLPWSLHPAFLAVQCISHCLKLHSVITPFSRSVLFQHQCLSQNNTFFTAAALPGMEWASWLWWKPFFAIFKLHCFIILHIDHSFPFLLFSCSLTFLFSSSLVHSSSISIQKGADSHWSQ